MTFLSVNVNKIAVLRNSRGGAEPDVVQAARTCLDAGAHGITGAGRRPRPGTLMSVWVSERSP